MPKPDCPDCGSIGVNDVSENDDEYDYFCVICGGLFTEEEMEEEDSDG